MGEAGAIDALLLLLRRLALEDPQGFRRFMSEIRALRESKKTLANRAVEKNSTR